MKKNIIKLALAVTLFFSFSACQTVQSPSKKGCCDTHHGKTGGQSIKKVSYR
jgi:hypothetical protein